MAKGGQRRSAPPTTDQVEEHARFRVMQVLRTAPHLSLVVLNMRGDEVAWLDILNYLLSQLQ